MTVCAYDSIFVLEQDGQSASVFLSLKEAMLAGADGGDESTTITQFRGIDSDSAMRVSREFALVGPNEWRRIDKDEAPAMIGVGVAIRRGFR